MANDTHKSLLCNLLKTYLKEFFEDMLRISKLTIQQKYLLAIGQKLTEGIDSETMMKTISKEIKNYDIDNNLQDPQELFKYIYSALNKKEIQYDIIKENIENIYSSLNKSHQEIIIQYAIQIKKTCENYLK